MTEHGLAGMASLSGDREISMAVVAPHRGVGHGTNLLVHVIQIAEQAEFGRVFLTSSRRSRPISRLGSRLGWTPVDITPGRLDLFLDLPRRQSAEDRRATSVSGQRQERQGPSMASQPAATTPARADRREANIDTATTDTRWFAPRLRTGP